MIGIYKILLNLIKLFINSLFITQIVLIILIFLTASYWFFDLIGSSLFSFAEPICNAIVDFMKLFYNRDIEVGGVYVDGSLLLFDIIALIIIFSITKFKYYVYMAQDFIAGQIKKCKKNLEDNFNVQLKKDADEIIKKYSEAALLINFKATDLRNDNLWGGQSDEQVENTEQYLLDTLCSNLDQISYAKYKKGKTKVMIHLKEFDKIDGILNLISQFVYKNRTQMQQNRWTVDYYCSAVVFSNGANIELDVLPKLEMLLNTKSKNEIVCFGDFNLRYALKTKPIHYTLRLKGSYEIDGGSDVYCLIKKN